MLRNSFFLIVLLAILKIHAGKEIELKIQVSHEQEQNIITWLTKNAQYRGSTVQTEYYLTKKDEAYDYSAGFKDTLRTLRVRLEETGDSVCYKYRHIDPTTKKTTHRDEEETKVANGNVALTIFKNLGYTEETLVLKARLTYSVDDTFEVVLDAVDTVGNFIEIELKEKNDNVQEGLYRIKQLMKKMGISEYTQYDRGYIHMIWNPEYNFGEAKKI